MEDICDVKIEVKDGQLIIYDPYRFVSNNKTIMPIKIVAPQKPERNYKIIRTKKDGYMFQ